MSMSNARVDLEPAQASAVSGHKSILPGARLLQAAMSGLLVAGAAGCDDDTSTGQSKQSQTKLDEEELDAVCEDRVDDAVKEAKEDQDVDTLCADMVKDAKASVDAEKLCADKVKSAVAMVECEKPDAEKLCADMVKTAADKCLPLTATTEEKTKNSEQKEYKFAELTKRCDERGGYIQIHGSCGGVGACAGFSFGDWGPDGAVLTEHSCSGSNGCNGLSCVVLPKDTGRSGKEVYEAKFEEPGPGACINCHAVWADDHENKDVTKFRVIVMPGSTRTTANWLERSAAEQERVVAFGVHGTLPNGLAYNNMSAYHKVLSRGEIKRVVEHLRTLTPVMKEVKLVDPMAMAEMK